MLLAYFDTSSQVEGKIEDMVILRGGYKGVQQVGGGGLSQLFLQFLDGNSDFITIFMVFHLNKKKKRPT